MPTSTLDQLINKMPYVVPTTSEERGSKHAKGFKAMAEFWNWITNEAVQEGCRGYTIECVAFGGHISKDGEIPTHIMRIATSRVLFWR